MPVPNRWDENQKKEKRSRKREWEDGLFSLQCSLTILSSSFFICFCCDVSVARACPTYWASPQYRRHPNEMGLPTIISLPLKLIELAASNKITVNYPDSSVSVAVTSSTSRCGIDEFIFLPKHTINFGLKIGLLIDKTLIGEAGSLWTRKMRLTWQSQHRAEPAPSLRKCIFRNDSA